VRTVGVDTPSVDAFAEDGLSAHHALVDSDMTWLEGLFLGEVEPGSYFMVALPMALTGCEAAPVRAVVRPVEGV
jgi:arylformamidase